METSQPIMHSQNTCEAEFLDNPDLFDDNEIDHAIDNDDAIEDDFLSPDYCSDVKATFDTEFDKDYRMEDYEIDCLDAEDVVDNHNEVASQDTDNAFANSKFMYT
jgi:hypothetical protein